MGASYWPRLLQAPRQWEERITKIKVREAARVLGREGEVARAITDPEKKNRNVQVQFNLRTPNVTEEARDKTQKTYAWEAVLMPSWT